MTDEAARSEAGSRSQRLDVVSRGQTTPSLCTLEPSSAFLINRRGSCADAPDDLAMAL
jgi:hypothetical protein